MHTHLADVMNYDRRAGDSELFRFLGAIEGRDLNTNPNVSPDGFDSDSQELACRYMALIAAGNGALLRLRCLLNDR